MTHTNRSWALVALLVAAVAALLATHGLSVTAHAVAEAGDTPDTVAALGQERSRRSHSAWIIVRPVPATATPTPASPKPTPTLSLIDGRPKVCPRLDKKGVPASAIRRALEDPSRISGWAKPANPNLPPSPWNPRRRCLTIQNMSTRYHYLYNGLVFKAGCP